MLEEWGVSLDKPREGLHTATATAVAVGERFLRMYVCTLGSLVSAGTSSLHNGQRHTIQSSTRQVRNSPTKKTKYTVWRFHTAAVGSWTQCCFRYAVLQLVVCWCCYRTSFGTRSPQRRIVTVSIFSVSRAQDGLSDPRQSCYTWIHGCRKPCPYTKISGKAWGVPRPIQG